MPLLVFVVSPAVIALVCHVMCRRFLPLRSSFLAAMVLSILSSLAVFFFSDWAIRGYPQDYLTPWLLIPLIVAAAIFGLIAALVGLGVRTMSGRIAAKWRQ
jgi:prepilin signal peptidase PulO-like enzyme (type II secretory pathway)